MLDTLLNRRCNIEKDSFCYETVYSLMKESGSYCQYSLLWWYHLSHFLNCFLVIPKHLHFFSPKLNFLSFIHSDIHFLHQRGSYNHHFIILTNKAVLPFLKPLWTYILPISPMIFLLSYLYSFFIIFLLSELTFPLSYTSSIQIFQDLKGLVKMSFFITPSHLPRYYTLGIFSSPESQYYDLGHT